MASNYIIHLTQSSYCPHCNERVSLLCDKDGEQKPSFYICWNCEFVGEIGVGPVKEFLTDGEKIK
jgi:transcription elongation factor Elf1